MCKRNNEQQNNNDRVRPETGERRSIKEDYTIRFERPQGNPPDDPPKQPEKDD